MTSARTNSKLHRCIIETLESRQMLSAAGVLDPSFSLDGKATVDFGPGFNSVATAVAVQADGKTIVVGERSQALGKFAVARFNLDGSLDTTFGEQGKVITSFGNDNDAKANGLVIQGDGKIVVVGDAGVDDHTGGHGEFAIVRYNPNGTLDPTFDGDGIKTVAVQDEAAANDVALQNDGKIVVVGSSHNDGFFGPSEPDFAIVRLNPNGSLDRSFDGDGKQTIDFGVSDEARAVAIDYTGTPAANPNYGKIVLAGSTAVTGGAGSERIALTRLNINGHLDASFNSGGKVYTTIPGEARSAAFGMVIQPTGKIVIAGTTGQSVSGDPGGDHQFALARYDAAGKLDPTFGAGGNGLVETRFDGNDKAFDIIPSASGGLIVGGSAGIQFALAGYTADGVLDNSFGVGGKVKLDFGQAAGQMGLATGPGLRFVLAGGKKFSTARFLDSGANQVFVGTFNPNAAEGGQSTNFIVSRSERLPVPTRVYFSIGGTANAPGNLPFVRPDYTLDGMTFLSTGVGTAGALASAVVTAPVAQPVTAPYVDIPANQTFAVVTLKAVDDARLELTETATFSIRPDPSYEISKPGSTTINIADNDQVQVNFQAAGASAPAGTVADTGSIFGDRGNGLSYGWDADNTANGRIRHNNRSPDFRFDSFNHMQKNGANRKWELAVPNGLYQVTLAAGDPNAVDSVYKMNLEGVLALSGTPGGNTHWFTRTINVRVNDGRLTLTNAAGALNNKIAWIAVRSAPVGAAAGAVTGNTPVNLVLPPILPPVVPPVKKITGSLFSTTLLQ